MAWIDLDYRWDNYGWMITDWIIDLDFSVTVVTGIKKNGE
jgi:hypothetical protein